MRKFGTVILLALTLVVFVSATAQAKVIPGHFIVVLNNDVADPGDVARELSARHGLIHKHVYSVAIKGFSAKIPAHKLQDMKADPRVSYIEPDAEIRAIVIDSGPPLPPGDCGGGEECQPPLPPFSPSVASVDTYNIGNGVGKNAKGGNGKGGGGGGGGKPSDPPPTPQVTPTGVDRIDADLSATAKIDGLDERVDVDIAILDSGVSNKHPDINFYRGVTVQGSGRPGGRDDYGHGTHVAGIAAALDNDMGVVGVAPGARIWSVKVLDKNGSGTFGGVIAGIDWVTSHADEIEVANMSLGGINKSDALRTAIANSVAAGIFYAVSAGNDFRDIYGPDGIFNTYDDAIPAAYPEVAAVSAIADFDGRPGGDYLAGFSNYSGSVDPGNPVVSFGAAIDLAAPGVNINSTMPPGAYLSPSCNDDDGDGYGECSGTSMASPHVAGAAALYISSNPGVSVAAVRQYLIDNAVAQGSINGYSGDPDGNPESLLEAGGL